MTEAELAAIQARCDAATPGPWSYGRAIPGLIRFVVANVLHENIYPATNEVTHGTTAVDDARFIAAAREDVPRLLAELGRKQSYLAVQDDLLARAQKEMDALREQLREAREEVKAEIEEQKDIVLACAKERDALREQVCGLQTAEVELEHINRALTAEVEAYKRAKAENDERFMTERDEARAEVERLKGEVAEAREISLEQSTIARRLGSGALAEAKALLNRWLQRDDSLANCEATVQLATYAWLEANR